MAAGPFTIFDVAKKKFFNGTFDLDTDNFRAVLCTSAQALDETFVGASTDCRYSDLTAEASNGSGYTTTGILLASKTLNLLAGVVTWDAADLTWSALTKSDLAYLVIYDDSATNDPLVGFAELEVGGVISPAGVDTTVRFNAAGILTAE